MAKDWAKVFYGSTIWQRQRDAYRRSVHGICEECGEPGDIVHHRKPLTPRTINDPRMTLAFDNLQLLCYECHRRVHDDLFKRSRDTADGLMFDAHGELIESPPIPAAKGGTPHRRDSKGEN